jgi:PAS domain S-box-containing protein
MFRNQESGAFGRSALPLWLRMVSLALGYYLCAWAGSFLSPPHSTNVSFWLPSGLFVAVLLLNPTRDWIWLALAVLPANTLFDYQHDASPNFLLILVFYLCNVIRSFLGAWLVRQYVAESPTLCTLKEFWGVMAIAGIFSAAVGATLGAAALRGFGLSPSFVSSWWVWWTGSGMAVLVFSPLLLTWLRRNPVERQPPFSTAKKIEATALFVLMSAATWLFVVYADGMDGPVVTLLVFMLWAGLRFGVRGAALAVFWLAVLMTFLTTHYLEAFAPAASSSAHYVVMLQVYLAVAAFTGLIPAIIVAERERTVAELRDSESRFRTLTEAAFEGIFISENGKLLDVNDRGIEMFGYDRGEMAGKEIISLVAPGSLASVSAAIRGERENIYGHELRRKDGSLFFAEAQAKHILSGGRKLRMTALRDITERKRTETLNRLQQEVLEMIADGRPMAQTLEALVRLIETQASDLLCSVLLLDRDGIHFRHGAAPSLPAEYLAAVDGAAIGPNVGSCGAAMSRGEAVLTGDIANDPMWANYRQLAVPYGLRACWSTPIFDPHHKVLGSFAIFRRQVGLPEERHQRLIDMATYTAAVCISRHRSELERAEAVAREQQSRIKYTLQLIAAQEEERARIAGELHDSLGQNLLLINNRALMSLRQADNPPETREQLESIKDLIASCIAETRRISHDLHPPLLDHLGLTQALKAMIEKTGEASEIIFTQKLEPVDEFFTAGGAMNFYRIVQESLNNILKHSGAKHADIQLERDIHEVQLWIADDGRGFLTDKPGEGQPGLGLKNMADRARMLGGRMSIESQPGEGTRIGVTVPMMEKNLEPAPAREAGGRAERICSTMTES